MSMKYWQRGEWWRMLTREDQRWVGNCGFGRGWKHGRAPGHFSSQVFLWLRSIVECARVSECLVKYTQDKLSSRAYLSSCRVHHTFLMTLGWVGWGKVAWGRSGPASPVPGCRLLSLAPTPPLPHPMYPARLADLLHISCQDSPAIRVLFWASNWLSESP